MAGGELFEQRGVPSLGLVDARLRHAPTSLHTVGIGLVVAFVVALRQRRALSWSRSLSVAQVSARRTRSLRTR